MQRLLIVVRRLGLVLGIAFIPLLLIISALVISRAEAGASSHREAPLISKDAFADNTDTYVFISPENANNVVLVASWIPFEGPEGGPNYWEWDDDVLYDIYLDVDGSATADVTYTVSSKVMVANPETFLYNTGPINNLDDATWNRRQYITITEAFAPGMQPSGGTTRNLVANQLTAPVNIGSKSTPNYGGLETAAIREYTADNGDKINVFAGQTDDPFFVDLQVFDLLTLRGEDPPVGYSQGNNIPTDAVAGYNVHSLVVEVPISRLKRNGDPVFGVWAGSRRQSMAVMGDPNSGQYKQVSRLGMPLVNEVVLPMGLKDVFNSIQPQVDLSVYGMLQESVEDPEIGNLLCALYSIPLPGDTNDDCKTEYMAGTPRTGRADLFDIFLTGMVLKNPFAIQTKNGAMTLPPGFNVNRPQNPAINLSGVVSGVVPAEMIRINTDIKGDLCHPTPQRLGVLAGDACGFPNGRRLMDDVVEIELLAVAGAAYPVLDGRDTNFSFNSVLINVLTDNIDENDLPFRNTFPYVAPANSGQSHWHDNPIFAMLVPWVMKDDASR